MLIFAMPDYLEVEYSEKKRPKTTYPAKLANYLFTKYELSPGQEILEIGSGRAELLIEFNKLGLECWAVDSARSAGQHLRDLPIEFQEYKFTTGDGFEPFENRKFDIIFTKSFVEHIHNPIEFSLACFKLLKPGGKLITLTPDFEMNYRIFYDDLTHIKPFTEISLRQMYEYGHYQEIKVERFMQLPSTWNSQFMNLFARISRLIAPSRTRNKWLRWSRELMVAGVGIRPFENSSE